MESFDFATPLHRQDQNDALVRDLALSARDLRIAANALAGACEGLATFRLAGVEVVPVEVVVDILRSLVEENLRLADAAEREGGRS